MADILEIKVADKILAVNPMRTHSRNLSWGGQGTPLSRKLSASPKVVSALASATSHRRTGSLKQDFATDLPVEFRQAASCSSRLLWLKQYFHSRELNLDGLSIKEAYCMIPCNSLLTSLSKMQRSTSALFKIKAGCESTFRRSMSMAHLR